MSDPDWTLRPDISPHDVAASMRGRAAAALPPWPRAPRLTPAPSADAKPPYVPPTVKGKCPSPSGERTRGKPFSQLSPK
eukprot:2302204-Pyramimonas_sp.AAC.1